MSFLEPKTGDMFYFTGEQKTTPSCPVELAPDFNPSSASQSYENRDAQCSSNCQYVSLASTKMQLIATQKKFKRGGFFFLHSRCNKTENLYKYITILTSTLHNSKYIIRNTNATYIANSTKGYLQ